MRILGLDISTTCVGVAVVSVSSGSLHIDALEHIEFKGCETLWEKADHVELTLGQLLISDLNFKLVDRVYVEDAALRFTPGQSSAATLSTLLRFNGLVTYIARDVFGVEPEFIAAGHARKLCGMKMQQRKKCGKSHKEQVFDYMMANDLKHITWPMKKRSSNVVDWSRDVTDAYVIARAGSVLYNQPIQ